MTETHHAPIEIDRDERGFTLIELLVVMLIISVLAAIAIPSFLGQAAKASDVTAKDAVHTAQRAVFTYGVDHSGGYCGVTVPQLLAIEPTLADQPSLSVSTCPGSSGEGYTISVTSSSGVATVYTLTESGGALTLTCSTPGSGGCSASGTW